MIDIETAATPEAAEPHSRMLAVLVAATVLAAAAVSVLLVRADQRADRAYVVANRNSVQVFTKAEFRTVSRDVVRLAYLRAQELRALGAAGITSDDPRELHRSLARIEAADRLEAAIDTITPSVEAAALPGAAADILFAGDEEIDALVADQVEAIEDLGREGDRSDRASYSLTLIALTGVLLGLAAIIGVRRPARIVLGAAKPFSSVPSRLPSPRSCERVCESVAMGLKGVAAALAVVALVGCGGGSSDGSSTTAGGGGGGGGAVAELGDGPVTLVALGDSLTAGDGDDSGAGYVGRITDAIGAAPGREGSTLVNLGQSGWDSTMMVEGDGTFSQLTEALEEIERARGDGTAVLATVLIGSNDLWYVYQNGPEDGTPAEDEDAALETFRTNLDRTVRELQDAGAVVVVGLPDDQSVRPGAADIDRLQVYLPNVTEDEVDQMSKLAQRFDEVAAEVAAEHGAPTVDTNDPLWSDPDKMADDGIHPNGAGYEDLAELWLKVVEPLL